MIENFNKPWCLIDSIKINNEEIESQKYVSFSDFFLIGHFKDYSVFPGMLMIEGILQSVKASHINGLTLEMFSLINIQSRFLRSVYPGEIIYYSIILDKTYQDKIVIQGKGRVNNIEVVRVKLIFQKRVDDGG